MKRTINQQPVHIDPETRLIGLRSWFERHALRMQKLHPERFDKSIPASIASTDLGMGVLENANTKTNCTGF